MKSETLDYKHDNSRTGFDCGHEEHFSFPLYQIVKIITPTSLDIKVGDLFYGKKLNKNQFMFCGEKYGFADGSFIIAKVKKIINRRSYVDYLKTIDPINLRSDYYNGYIITCERYGVVPKLIPGS